MNNKSDSNVYYSYCQSSVRILDEKFFFLHNIEIPEISSPKLQGAGPAEVQASVAGSAPAPAGGADAPLIKKKKKRDPDAPIQGEGALGGYVGAIFYLAYHFFREILNTIFSSKNIVFTGDRSGLSRSAIFLVFFMVIHAIGNLHIFLGPDDFNGYGYFYVRLYWTGFGLPANIVEEYLLLAALLHVAVALKREERRKIIILLWC